MVNEKIAIFPVNYENASLIRFAFMRNIDPIALISPDLSTLSGKDISNLDGGSIANIDLRLDYKQCVCECDILYMLESYELKEDNIYNELISYAHAYEKKVLFSPELNKRLNSIEANLHSSNEIQVNDFSSKSNLYKIDTPIISIFSLGENSGQLATELSVRNFFDNKGYNALQFGNPEYSEVTGWIGLPDFIFDSTIDEYVKSVAFNRFVYNHNKEIEPDVIIIGVPRPIMKFNDDILNGLGMLPFTVQSAINSDIGILSLYHTNFNHEYLEMLSNLCKYRFGVEAKFFSVSNTQATKNLHERGKLDLLYVTSDYVTKNISADTEKDEFTLFSIYDNENLIRACERIENELSSNIEAI